MSDPAGTGAEIMAFILAKNTVDYCNNAVCSECTNASGKRTDCGVRILVCRAVDKLAFTRKNGPLSSGSHPNSPTQNHQSLIFISDRATTPATFLPGKLYRFPLCRPGVVAKIQLRSAEASADCVRAMKQTQFME